MASTRKGPCTITSLGDGKLVKLNCSAWGEVGWAAQWGRLQLVWTGAQYGSFSKRTSHHDVSRPLRMRGPCDPYVACANFPH